MKITVCNIDPKTLKIINFELKQSFYSGSKTILTDIFN